MKQTATEWLFEKLWETPKDKLTWNALLEQAKEMEKKQIMEAYHEQTMKFYCEEEAEQYYKDNYGE
jgi:hypothetical protein